MSKVVVARPVGGITLNSTFVNGKIKYTNFRH